MILVTGATGPFGSAAIQFLIKQGMDPKMIAGLARDEKKAERLKLLGIDIRIGNYDDYHSLVAAFDGIRKLLMVSGSEVDKRDKQHDNIVRAARQTGVEYVVYTSFYRKFDDPESPIKAIAKTHIDTENLLMGSGMHYTLLRNALYAEVLPMFIGDNVMESGIWLPAGEGRVPFASRTDMAEAAARVIAGNNHTDRIYRIVNSVNYSFNDIAGIISEVSNKNVTYSSPSDDDYVKMLSGAGVPISAIHAALSWAQGIRQHYFESDGSDLEMLLGRSPKNLKELLSKKYS